MALSIVKNVKNRPKFFLVHAQEGWGKTSLAAQAPGVVFIQVGSETGLLTLIEAGQLPPTPHFPQPCLSFAELLEQVEWLRTQDHKHRTLAVDTLNGGEALCHELVLERDYNGDNSEKGFFNYYVGYRTALQDWRMLLKQFELLRTERKMAIIALCHTTKRTFKNPEGKDYDRYEPAFAARDTWDITKQMADAVLYGSFYTEVQSDEANKKSSKGKATGGYSRLMYTQRTATYDAKNRLGLPEVVEADGGAATAWKNLADAIVAGRQNGKEN